MSPSTHRLFTVCSILSKSRSVLRYSIIQLFYKLWLAIPSRALLLPEMKFNNNERCPPEGTKELMHACQDINLSPPSPQLLTFPWATLLRFFCQVFVSHLFCSTRVHDHTIPTWFQEVLVWRETSVLGVQVLEGPHRGRAEGHRQKETRE